MRPLATKIQKWSKSSIDGLEYFEINARVGYYEEKLFFQFVPTLGPEPEFRDRLERWLDNLADEDDQRTLFRAIPDLFFVGIGEFDALYRAAYSGPILRWLLDKTNLSPSDPTFNRRLNIASRRTWYCSVTDSMQIGHFYHINKLPGGVLRPDWSSLRHLGDQTEITSYMHTKHLERIVLLEDFVGSGEQMEGIVDFACSTMPNTQILLIPLIICPAGLRRAHDLAAKHANLTVEPIIPLSDSDLISEVSTVGEPKIHDELRVIASREYPRLVAGARRGSLYGPLGFEKTGALIILYSNCPDNSLPLIHHSSVNWNALFPRISRV